MKVRGRRSVDARVRTRRGMLLPGIMHGLTRRPEWGSAQR